MHARLGTMLSVVAAVTLVANTVLPSRAVAAQGSSDWQKMTLTGLTYRVYTPPSGALFVLQGGGVVVRSDDAGISWARVNLPQAAPTSTAARQFALDPLNHTVMYTSGVGGLYKTTNDADSWSVVLPTDEVVMALTVSQADPSLVYLALADKPAPNVTVVRLLRSRDSAISWDVLEELGANCISNIQALTPHPTDAQRVFRQQTCNPGGSVNGALAESRDQGSTWTKLVDVPGARPWRIAGGQGIMAQRLYAHLIPVNNGTNSMMRSDDDGASWVTTTDPWAGLALPAEADRLNISGLSPDPSIAGRIYAGFSAYQTNREAAAHPFLLSRVVVSDDAGVSWSDTGFPGEQVVVDVKLGIDGKNLYAATTSGIWRLPLGGN